MKKLLLTLGLIVTSFLCYGQSISSVSPSTTWGNENITVKVQGLSTLFLEGGSLPMTLVSSVDGSIIHSISSSVFGQEYCQGTFFIQSNATLGPYTLNIFTTNQGVLSRVHAVTVINAPKPSIVGIEPNFARNGQNMDVIIEGLNTKFTQLAIEQIRITYYMSFSTNAITVIDDTHLMASLSIPSNIKSGTYHIYVDTFGGTYAQLYSSFYINGVELVSVSPATATQGETVDITIGGTRTFFTQASCIEVEFYDGFGANGISLIYGKSVIVLNDSTLKTTVRFPKNVYPHEYSVIVYKDGERYIGNNNLFYLMDDGNPDPKFELASISPAKGYPGQTINLTIKGVNTHFAQSGSNIDMSIFRWESQVRHKAIPPSSFDVLSDTEIVARFFIPKNFGLGVCHFDIVSDVDGYMELLESFMMNEVGIDDETGLMGKLYPNPVHDNLYIDTKYPIRACCIVDITGKQTVVDPNEFKQANTHLIIPIDKLGLRKGIYFMRLDSENGFDYQKFIVE